MKEEVNTQVIEEEESEQFICSHCGEIIEGNDYSMMDNEIICNDCIENFTVTCDCCGQIIWDSDDCGDEDICLCHYCRDNRYSTCEECGALVYDDDLYDYEGYNYCCNCYNDIKSKSPIHDYYYKPEPKFYGKFDRYFGIELEIDYGGQDDDNAQELLDIANHDDEHIYIKHDGSLDEGMEIVTHPMTLDYHTQFCWEDIMHRAVEMGYRSHQTSTCGLHIHVNRDSLGATYEKQDDTISRILYFVEHHWNELLKFSRRTEYSIERWASRYGYESSPKAILDKAKKGDKGRYAAINLCNSHTIEFRLFRGTLKHNTLIAALQMVNHICDAACVLSDNEIKGLSWSEFVAGIQEQELIQYLKERRLYINETIDNEEEI